MRGAAADTLAAMGAPTTFETRGCAQHRHPEFRLQLARTLVPGVERLLLSYLEGAVARGTRFEPGQTLQLGWGTLRVVERHDGTLGLQERDESGTWTETVDRTLHQTWYQKEVASSLSLTDRLAFPRQDQVAMVVKCSLAASSRLLTRLPSEGPLLGMVHRVDGRPRPRRARVPSAHRGGCPHAVRHPVPRPTWRH
jgi:hypothetical protein